ncbi:MAG: hypothetical protein AB7H90_21005 [Alphaproteobacteria bacterium]
MLLHGVVGPQMGGDLGVDLVPRPADLALEKAAQRRQVLVELLPVAGDVVTAAQALVLRQVIKGRGRPGRLKPPRGERSTITRAMSARMAQLLWRREMIAHTHGPPGVSACDGGFPENDDRRDRIGGVALDRRLLAVNARIVMACGRRKIGPAKTGFEPLHAIASTGTDVTTHWTAAG